jgi:hypothetical protein
MTRTDDLIYVAKKALDHARILGCDCRNIIINQREGSNVVHVLHNGCELLWQAGAHNSTHYIGRPSRAIRAIGAELYYMA